MFLENNLIIYIYYIIKKVVNQNYKKLYKSIIYNKVIKNLRYSNKS